jgi:hypothetical protein
MNRIVVCTVQVTGAARFERLQLKDARSSNGAPAAIAGKVSGERAEGEYQHRLTGQTSSPSKGAAV